MLLKHGGRRYARTLSKLKNNNCLRAVRLAPEVVKVGIDSDKHIGLPTVRYPGLGSLHLPADTDFPR